MTHETRTPTAIEASPVVGEIEAVDEELAARIAFGALNKGCCLEAEECASLQSENQALREKLAVARVQSDRFCDKYLAALKRVGAAESQVQSLTLKLEEWDKALERLKRTGNEMANICCGLKQRTNGLLTTEERREMGVAQTEWDEAIAYLRRALQSGGAEHD